MTRDTLHGDPYFRLRGQQVLTTCICLIGVVYFLNALSDQHESLADILFTGSMGAAWAAMAVRAARAGAIARKDALVVRNILRTFTVPWYKIEEFAFGRVHLTGHMAPVARLRTGGRVPIAAFMFQPFPRPKRMAQEVVDELNVLLAQRTNR